MNLTKVGFCVVLPDRLEPKDKTNTAYAYEDAIPMTEHTKNFNTSLATKNDSSLLDEALSLYTAWVAKIENESK